MYRIFFRKSVLNEYKSLETTFGFLIWIIPGTKRMSHILKLAKPRLFKNGKIEFGLNMRKAPTLQQTKHLLTEIFIFLNGSILP